MSTATRVADGAEAQRVSGEGRGGRGGVEEEASTDSAASPNLMGAMLSLKLLTLAENLFDSGDIIR